MSINHFLNLILTFFKLNFFSIVQIHKLPGIQYNSEQQLKAMKDLRQSLQMKRQLLLKYRHMYSFDVPKY